MINQQQNEREICNAYVNYLIVQNYENLGLKDGHNEQIMKDMMGCTQC